MEERENAMRILHLTDIHAGWNPDECQEQVWWDQICKAILAEQAEYPFDLVAVTGDFCKMGSEWEFERALRYLNQLKEQMGFRADQFFFCQGNHDADTQDVGASFSYYEAFQKQFYGAEGAPKQGTMVAGDGQIFMLNTCTTTCWPDFDDATLVDAAVDEVLELADESRKTVLLMHHQPEILDDQSQLARLGQSGRIRCILSGHLHCYARLYARKGMPVVNGLPLMPHMDFIPTGFQVVEILDEGAIHAWMCLLTGEGSYRRYPM